MKYSVPRKYHYRIHHVRPRFKNNVEEVLLFIANAISSTDPLSTEAFKTFLNAEIRKFPGNQNKKLKTIDNWRTEISALFSLYFDRKGFSHPSSLAVDLGEGQDLTKFFKYFLFTFQYPRGHIKAEKVQDLLNRKILFHPANYFLRVMANLCNFEKKEGYLTKGEACHMIFNDLRATKDFKYEKTKEVARRIVENRKSKIEYNLAGDVIRYAGDILDYMVLGNLLKDFGGKFFLNKIESRTIKKFTQNKKYFQYRSNDLDTISSDEKNWVGYVCGPVDKKRFETDVLTFIAKDEAEYKELVRRTSYIQTTDIPKKGARAKDIGDYGESLIHGHECMFLKINGRKDLIRLVQCIPDRFATGYDIQSVELDETKKYIEVKSTISNKKLTFNKFKLTKNELGSAQTLGKHYFVYRLQIVNRKNGEKPSTKPFVIRDPIKLFKNNEIKIDITTGEVNLGSYGGQLQELLYWKD